MALLLAQNLTTKLSEEGPVGAAAAAAALPCTNQPRSCRRRPVPAGSSTLAPRSDLPSTAGTPASSLPSAASLPFLCSSLARASACLLPY